MEQVFLEMEKFAGSKTATLGGSIHTVTTHNPCVLPVWQQISTVIEFGLDFAFLILVPPKSSKILSDSA